MHKRFLATTIAASLLFSLGGTILVAALCPHLRSAQVPCNTHVVEPTMSHEGMGEMEMSSTEEAFPNPDPNAVALGQPVGFCPHCAVHSRTTPNAVSIKETELSKRSGTFAIPEVVPSIAPIEVSAIAALTSRAHGPPGTNTPRHILINIFRI